MECKFYLHSKDIMWQGAVIVLSEKSDELIGVERLELIGLYNNIQATRLL